MWANITKALKSAIYAVIIFLIKWLFCRMVKRSSYDKAAKEIGQKLKELRIEKGFTSYENFALENNIDRKQYWRIENGHNLTLKSLIKILDIHGISLKSFFSEKE